jgi:hypothetical protein
MTKKIVALLFVLASFYWLNQYGNASPTPVTLETNQLEQARPAESTITSAFEQQLSDVEVEGFGQIIKILSDDNEGSRHQKFLLKLTSSQTLLIAHNIDIAPRIDDLKVGDIVYFKGEYEWNPKGGVVHWTHHDPQGNHVGGWLELNGKRYQ